MIAYLDLPSGLSGDMFLGCLVDAGWPVTALRATIERLALPTEAWSVRAESVMRGPLRATQVHVDAPEETQHRNLDDVRALVDAAELPESVKEAAIATFTRLAEAEAAVHGQSVEDVHFHEVGALDSIIDIVGAAAGLHALDIERLYASAVPLGEGWADTRHGRIPIPAPATMELLSGMNAPTRPSPGTAELVTPTGAAILAQFATFEQPSMRLLRTGTGAGRRDFEWPNVARLVLAEAQQSSPMVQLETNIDDMNPELYADVRDRLFEAGARDVWLVPIQMKKDRPGVLLAALAPSALEPILSEIILRETTTLGLRVQPVERREARREKRTVETNYGTVSVKLKWVDEELLGATPEYDECRRLADTHGVPTRLVYEAAQAAARTFFEEQDVHADSA